MEHKLTGFLRYSRKDPGYRPKKERLKDYRGVEKKLPLREIGRQAARCMDCGTPFCHAYGCPLMNLIPEFNDWVYRERWKEALDILTCTNNFPEFTGRVCPAPCEAACVAGVNGDPVTIRQIELSIIERGFEKGDVRPSGPTYRLGKKVAVVGAGPAGLAAADTLNKAGYQVTIFDSANRPGGILRYGIPDFKLEKWVVERRVKLMKEEGVAFETCVTVGEDISYRYLKDRFDAICLACGARRPRDLEVPGRGLKGIHFAMDYLVQQNKRISGEPIDGEQIWAGGKHVVVIGGGDTGSDCVGTALRQGAKTVHQLEILPKPPGKRAESTPWPMWPQILRTTHAHKEGGKRRWSVKTQKFLGKNGQVRRLYCVEVDWKSPGDGTPPIPIERPGSEFTLNADLVLLSMGFVGPERNKVVEELGIASNSSGHVKVDRNHMTCVPGVFVAGDMAQGQSLVVRAVVDGRRAAGGIMKYLSEIEGGGRALEGI